MQWSDVQRDPDRRTLRQFAAIWVVFFGGLAVYQQAVGGRPLAAAIFAVVAATVGPIGLLWPRAVRHVFVTWSVVAFPIGWAVSWLALGLLFYGVFTPMGLLFRLIGRDALMRRRPRGRDTYWTAVGPPPGVESYFRQS
jgi:hypothetical protein